MTKDPMTPPMEQDAAMATLYCYGIQFAGRDGWEIWDSLLDEDALKAKIAAEGLDVAAVRLICRGLTAQKRVHAGASSCLIVHHHGWAYDPLVGRWGAPDLPVALPENRPVEAKRLGVVISKPRHGWMGLDLWVRPISQQNAAIAMSAVYDPLPVLVRWLEAIADGGTGRVEIDEEGRSHELMAFAVEGRSDDIRLVVRRNRAETALVIDAILPRRRLVEPFWRALRGFEESPGRAKRHWWYCQKSYHLRSPALDAYLVAGQARGKRKEVR